MARPAPLRAAASMSVASRLRSTICASALRARSHSAAGVRRAGPVERASESHVAIAVERRAEDIIALAQGVGWHARVCNRGGLFDVVEVWVENAYLVEVLDPTQLAD